MGEAEDGVLLNDTSVTPKPAVPFSPFMPGVPGLPSEPGSPGMPGMPGMAGCPVQPLWARETPSRASSSRNARTPSLRVFIAALAQLPPTGDEKVEEITTVGTPCVSSLVQSLVHVFSKCVSAIRPDPALGAGVRQTWPLPSRSWPSRGRQTVNRPTYKSVEIETVWSAL